MTMTRVLLLVLLLQDPALRLECTSQSPWQLINSAGTLVTADATVSNHVSKQRTRLEDAWNGMHFKACVWHGGRFDMSTLDRVQTTTSRCSCKLCGIIMAAVDLFFALTCKTERHISTSIIMVGGWRILCAQHY